MIQFSQSSQTSELFGFIYVCEFCAAYIIEASLIINYPLPGQNKYYALLAGFMDLCTRTTFCFVKS